jgi:hypothetical protein
MEPAGARPGPWAQLITYTIRGKKLGIQQYQKLQDTGNPDEILKYFPQEAARAILVVALQTGFEVFLEAKAKPKETIPLFEGTLELCFNVQTTKT